MILAFTVLHILTMFVAFAFTTGVGIIMAAVAASGNVPAMRAATRLGTRFQTAGTIVFAIGLVFGFGLASMAGYGLGARWLIIAYVVAALLLGIGLGVHQPWIRRLSAAAAASPDDPPSGVLLSIAGERANRIAGPISGLLWIAIITDMVVKP